ncbi:hypothetical protein SLEP1_g47755 [Rubroshorea leprosula]|uniref:Uncharacterized protein n=1 Tax=Rubroshorea leprosula TaxID=152421 RepID=A0AAV5LRN5_9ROSI|nr:hypothetical protein SLEP1_g47755 [Rubroshorea leprosula]
MGNAEDNKMDTWSIPRLVSLLKETFRTRDFVMVEDVLTARENKSRSEIDKLKLEKQTFKDMYDLERLDKLSVKKELMRCKVECKEFSDQVARLREEKMMLRKELGEKDKEIIDRRRRICEMECSKTNDEAEIESLKNRCEELDTRLLRVEDEMTLLTSSNIVERGGGFEAKDNQENVEKTEGKVINDDKKQDVEVGDGPSCGTMIKDNGHLQSEESGGGCEAKNENQENVEKTKEKVITADKSIEKHPTSNVVGIIENEDVCSPSGIQNAKEMTLKWSAEGAHSRQTDIENRMLKRKRVSGLDMSDYEDGENVDDGTSSGKGKMKLQKSTCQPDVSLSSLNCCTEKAVSSRRKDVEKAFTPSTSRQSLEIMRQCEEKMESEDMSHSHCIISEFPLGSLGFENEESSTSESSESESSDVDMDFLYSQLTQECQMKNRK